MTSLNVNEKDTDPRVWVVVSSALNRAKVLVGKRSSQCNNPGAYGFFGGHMDDGETPKEAAVREMFEETGVTINPKNLTLIRAVDRKSVMLYYYALDVVHFGTQKPVLTKEVDAYLWFDCACSDERNEVMEDGVAVPLELHYSVKHYLKTQKDLAWI